MEAESSVHEGDKNIERLPRDGAGLPNVAERGRPAADAEHRSFLSDDDRWHSARPPERSSDFRSRKQRTRRLGAARHGAYDLTCEAA